MQLLSVGVGARVAIAAALAGLAIPLISDRQSASHRVAIRVDCASEARCAFAEARDTSERPVDGTLTRSTSTVRSLRRSTSS